MRSTRQLSITLPNDTADFVAARVAAGEYASESEVIRDGLRSLLARDQAVEAWLHERVVTAAAALEAEPGRALTAAEVRRRLAAQREAALAPGVALAKPVPMLVPERVSEPEPVPEPLRQRKAAL